jgi:hypothetical protein
VRVGHPAVAAVVGAVLLLLCGVRAPAVDLEGELEVYDVRPPEESVIVSVGDRLQFSVWVRGESLNYQWLLDGGPVSDRHSWTFLPAATQLGLHLVTVVVDGAEGRMSRSWTLRVTLPAEAPATTAPAATLPPPVVPLPSTSTVPSTSLPNTTSSSSSSSSSTIESTTSTSAHPTTTSRPTTTSTVRPTTTRPTTTSTVRPTTTERAPTTSTEPTTSTLRPTTPPTARSGGVTADDVRTLLQRYAAAWRAHDVAELEAVGQIATQGQAEALKSYFETVRDLDVEVTILEIKTNSDEATVRFIRRDRFRDPAGNLVSKDSPAIEKRVVRTPGGLRLAPK